MSRAAFALHVLCLLLFMAVGSAQGQGIQRTFVSTSGIDTGNCALSAPCRTFTYALTQTAPGGEIIVLTSGGYGPVEITKSVQITSPIGVYAAITALPGSAIGGTDAIRVNAGFFDIVALRGLTLNNVGVTNANGITFPSGSRLYIENVVINGFDNYGISVDRSASASPELYVADTIIRNGGTASTNAGIFLRQANTNGRVRTTIANSRLEGAGSYGLLATDNTRTTVRNTISTRSFFIGFAVGASTGTTAQLNLDNCTATFTNGVGIVAGISPFTGGTATAHISNSVSSTNALEGITVGNGNTTHISRSIIAGNGSTGIFIGPNATAHVSDSIIGDNASDGVGLTNNSSARIFVTATTISGNGGKGLDRSVGTPFSIGGNRVFDNVGGSDAFASNIPQQ
ncbi:MAG: right-handed parallel beta-helix repeat-containing protein [Casimicrobiaceae bacterium]